MNTLNKSSGPDDETGVAILISKTIESLNTGDLLLDNEKKNKCSGHHFSKNNHYVPRMYLKHWADDNKIYVYNLLVSNESVPLWQMQSISRTASMNKMYVRMGVNSEIDDIETWFAQEYEDPAAEPLEKLCNGEKIDSHEWIIVKDYMIAQYVRTVSFYIKTQKLTENILKSGLDSILAKLANGDIDFSDIHKIEPDDGIDMSLLPLGIDIIKEERNSQAYLSVETVAGKSTWLMTIKKHLSDASSIKNWMRQLHWSVVDCYNGVRWPTTDTPLVIINAQKPKDSFIGIAEPGNFFIFPINPTKALLAKNGKRFDHGMKLTYEESLAIKQAIVNNALLFVYSDNEDHEIVSMRRRLVDETEYKRIHNSLKQWHGKYLEKEVPLLQRIK